ncbi:hypothetical protein NIES267_35970 [Calothrix parasitica NIES-267]|uniref:Uncharacterized protein n=1 Tax=Calothrix parasitica NIES-267 TaxID=1973488 RepID=A0A1Z4LSG2_9CYAN|nr:hypothetical protein NIES267_35970 [Calothrix parasitica NIES-267]
MKNTFMKSSISHAKKIIGTTLFLSICSSSLALFNIQQANAQNLGQNLEQIRREAREAESQIDKQLTGVQTILNSTQGRALLENQKIQIRNQFMDLLSDELKYRQILANPSIPKHQKNLLRIFKVNPQALDRYIERQSNPEYIAEQQKSKIRTQTEVAEQRLKIRTLRSRLK